jgi:hypothetical protein
MMTRPRFYRKTDLYVAGKLKLEGSIAPKLFNAEGKRIKRAQ